MNLIYKSILYKRTNYKLLKIFIGALLMMALLNCTESIDERDEIIGMYSGVRIHGYYRLQDTVYLFELDTSLIIISLLKASSGLVQLDFNPSFNSMIYTFSYFNSTFKSTLDYQLPSLQKSNDSLFYFEQADIIPPDWISCFVKKI